MRNTLCNCHYSPSQTSFGCVEITLSVCSTLYAIVFGPYPSYRKLWKSLLHTNIAYDTRMCHAFFFFTKGHLSKFKVTGRKSENMCPVSVSLMERYWKILLYTKLAYDLMVCHDFYPRSIGQIQGHWKVKIHYTCMFPVYTFLMEKHWMFLFHLRLLMI